MDVDHAIFAPGFKQEPYWWEAAPRPRLEPEALPEKVDVAVVGSGFTGLSAALTLARAGREVAVIEARDPGFGASTRNAGFVGKTLKHSFREVMTKEGLARAIAVHGEARAAFDHVTELIEKEQISCGLERCGRFMGALSAHHYETMAAELELRRQHLGEEFEMVPRGEQHREVGSELYHGGAMVPAMAAVHPALYQSGLLDRVKSAGARVIANTPVTGLRREGGGFRVATGRGSLSARDVVLATNGYSGRATPDFRRRVIPFRAFMIATEPLGREVLARALPQGRTFHDYNNNLTYIRPAPDRSRLLLGALTGTVEDNLEIMATRLHGRLRQVFPELSGVRLSHCWSGYGAAAFDLYPHVGVRDGVHYAMGYCFAGLPMGTYLGHKAALMVLGSPEARTVFGERELPTRSYYWGRPWFVPAAMAYYNWLDRRGR